jgi:hypothetical protein
MGILSLKPSHQVGELKKALLEAILSGKAPNKW